MDADTRYELYRRLSEALPEPETELRFDSVFELLVAVILSAQSTDRSVNEATARLFPDANTPEQILALGEAGLKPYIQTIGLYNNKARNIIATCRKLVDDHGGEVPRERRALEALPGVGRKTASVVLNVAFGEPTIAVDTHIFRVANRTGLAPGKDARQVEAALEAALALGMTRRQALRKVILPQTVRTILPPVGNEFIALLKDSSLVSILAVSDLLRRGREYASTSFEYFESYTVVALVYLVITLFLSKLVAIMEDRLGESGH